MTEAELARKIKELEARELYITSLEGLNKELEGEVNAKQADIVRLENRYNAVKKLADETDGRLQSVQQQLQAATSHYQTSRDAIDTDIAHGKRELATVEQSIKTAQGRLDGINQTITERDQAATTQTIAIQKAMEDIQDQRLQLSNEIEALEVTKRQLEDAIADLITEREKIAPDIAAKRRAYEQEETKQRDILRGIAAEIKTAKHELVEVGNKALVIKQDIASREVEIDRKQRLLEAKERGLLIKLDEIKAETQELNEKRRRMSSVEHLYDI